MSLARLNFLVPSQTHNLRTFRANALSELSGSFGDLGTLLPLLIALTLSGSISLSTTLVFSGMANILTGLLFSLPLPVQPMKAIAAVAIARRFSIEDTAAAGLFTGAVIGFLSITGLLGWTGRVVPIPVVKGIQVGAGLSLVLSAGTSMLQPLGWITPSAVDNLLWALFAFILLLVTTYVPWTATAKGIPRVPYALLIFLLGLMIAFITFPRDSAPSSPALSGTVFHIWHPHLHIPTTHTFFNSALIAGLGQLPLTTLNSIIAVTHLSADLFPPPNNPAAPTPTALGLSVALMNLISCWFGSMPVCHGAGGLAAQHRFGARSGASVFILGVMKLVVGLVFAEEALVAVLNHFPRALLGVMVVAAGVQLASAGEGLNAGARDLWVAAEANDREIVRAEEGELRQGDDGKSERMQRTLTAEERQRRWTVMLITVAGLLTFKNDAVGFVAGLLCHWAYAAPTLWTKLKKWRERGSMGAAAADRRNLEERSLLQENACEDQERE